MRRPHTTKRIIDGLKLIYENVRLSTDFDDQQVKEMVEAGQFIAAMEQYYEYKESKKAEKETNA